MWEKTYSKTFARIEREKIWTMLTDINNWPKWDDDLDSCTLEGRFEVGNTFFLTPQGQKPVKITLTSIEEGYSFTDSSNFFGATMYAIHHLEETEQGLKITNILRVTGPLSWLWAKLVAENVARSVPEKTEALVQYAKGTHA